MNPKQKAKHLYGEFMAEQPVYEEDTFDENKKIEKYFAKRRALLCVNEIIIFFQWQTIEDCGQVLSYIDFWTKVKNELETF